MTTQRDLIVPSVHENNTSNGSDDQMHIKGNDALFIAKVRHLISLNITLLFSILAAPERKWINSMKYSLMLLSSIISLLAPLTTWKYGNVPPHIMMLLSCFLLNLIHCIFIPCNGRLHNYCVVSSANGRVQSFISIIFVTRVGYGYTVMQLIVHWYVTAWLEVQCYTNSLLYTMISGKWCQRPYLLN